MKFSLIGVFGDKELAKELAKKGTESDITLYCTITSVFQGYNQQQYLEHVSNISIF